MYQGEVNVAQEELNSFLAVAEDLRVKESCKSNILNYPRVDFECCMFTKKNKKFTASYLGLNPKQLW